MTVGGAACYATKDKGEVRRLIPRDEGETIAAGVRFLEYVGDAEGKIRRLLEHENLRGVRRR